MVWKNGGAPVALNRVMHGSVAADFGATGGRRKRHAGLHWLSTGALSSTLTQPFVLPKVRGKLGRDRRFQHHYDDHC